MILSHSCVMLPIALGDVSPASRTALLVLLAVMVFLGLMYFGKGIAPIVSGAVLSKPSAPGLACSFEATGGDSCGHYVAKPSKLALILNPHAGNQRGVRAKNEVLSVLEDICFSPAGDQILLTVAALCATTPGHLDIREWSLRSHLEGRPGIGRDGVAGVPAMYTCVDKRNEFSCKKHSTANNNNN